MREKLSLLTILTNLIQSQIFAQEALSKILLEEHSEYLKFQVDAELFPLRPNDDLRHFITKNELILSHAKVNLFYFKEMLEGLEEQIIDE